MLRVALLLALASACAAPRGAAVAPSAPAAAPAAPPETCQVDRGCPPSAPLPRCARAREEAPLARLVAAARTGTLKEGAASFTGVLLPVVGECLAAEKPCRCCNACNFYLAIAASPAALARGELLQVLAPGGTEAGRTCTGDPTLQCCPLPTGETPVRVSGRVAYGGRFRASVAAEEICLP